MNLDDKSFYLPHLYTGNNIFSVNCLECCEAQLRVRQIALDKVLNVPMHIYDDTSSPVKRP